jgi:hypothetical protein
LLTTEPVRTVEGGDGEEGKQTNEMQMENKTDITKMKTKRRRR